MEEKTQKQKYEVLILRRDMQHISVMKTEEFAVAKKKFKNLKEMWVNSLAETKTFDLEEPIMTSFDPGLIYEITLVPVAEAIQNVDDGNPYKKAMQNSGLSNMQNHNQMLDGGYK